MTANEMVEQTGGEDRVTQTVRSHEQYFHL
jgi:hypothetical protein